MRVRSHAEETTAPVMEALSQTTLSGYVDTSAAWNPGTAGPLPSPAAPAVPEPGTFTLAAVALSALSARRFRGKRNREKGSF